MSLRVVSIYQPCRSKGALSVHEQQRRVLQEANDDRKVRQAFLEDLREEVQTWIEQGNQLVIMGDVNESVFGARIVNFFEEFDMRNIIFERHPDPNPPRTHLASPEGRVIDGMWATRGITVTKCGYLEPGDFPGDHSLLYRPARVLQHNRPHHAGQ